MLTQMLILASAVVSLALGDEQQLQQTLAYECCKRFQVVPVVFNGIPKSCFGKLNNTSFVNGQIIETGGCALHECLLRKNKYLKSDGTLLVDNTWSMFLKATKLPYTGLMNLALAKCIGKYRKDSDAFKHEGCPTGIDALVRCVTDEMLKNCPSEFWYDKKARPQCPEKQIKDDTHEECSFC